jgi:hypothetical protein
MGLPFIKGGIECDGCGERFDVDLDAAYKPPASWSLWDVAEDAVRGGHVSGKCSLFDGLSSVQDGKMLCIPCTQKADEEAQ